MDFDEYLINNDYNLIEDEDCIDSTIFENDIDDIEDNSFDNDDSSEEGKIKYGY